MADPATDVRVNRTYADNAALASWLSDLSTDVATGKIVGMNVNTVEVDNVLSIRGTLKMVIPLSGISTALVDP